MDGDVSSATYPKRQNEFRHNNENSFPSIHFIDDCNGLDRLIHRLYTTAHAYTQIEKLGYQAQTFYFYFRNKLIFSLQKTVSGLEESVSKLQ
jgi:hypothetical protein